MPVLIDFVLDLTLYPVKHAGYLTLMKALLQSILLKFNYRILKADTVLFFEPFLTRCLKRRPDMFFIQVGANDGVLVDSLFDFVTRHHVRGLAIEPLGDVFEKLVKNYQPYPWVTPVRTAIHRSLKTVDIHRIDPVKLKQVGEWRIGTASLNPEHHKSFGVPDDCIIKETVTAMSLGELVKKYAVKRVDLLQIDTEGYDAEILKMLDELPSLPSLIRFEHGLPDNIMTRAVFLEVTDFLLKRDYNIVMEGYDAIAYRRELLD